MLAVPSGIDVAVNEVKQFGHVGGLDGEWPREGVLVGFSALKVELGKIPRLEGLERQGPRTPGMELVIQLDFAGATQAGTVSEPLQALVAALTIEGYGLLVIKREV